MRPDGRAVSGLAFPDETCCPPGLLTVCLFDGVDACHAVTAITMLCLSVD
jgi:hypothetical protein